METDRKAYYHEYYLKHRDKYLAFAKAQRENSPEKVKEYKKTWEKRNPEKTKEYKKRWKLNNPKLARARKMATRNNNADKKHNRYNGDNVTAKWIVEHIFSGQVCHVCGESDWRKLGCDRIDNAKPHTAENIVCSCMKCNVKRS